jgi:hypothetical protein
MISHLILKIADVVDQLLKIKMYFPQLSSLIFLSLFIHEYLLVYMENAYRQTFPT